MPRPIFQIGCTPDNLAIQIERRRSMRAEVYIDALTVGDWGGVSVACLLMNVFGLTAILAKQLSVPKDLAVFRVQAQSPERVVLFIIPFDRHGSRQVDAALPYDW